MSAILKSLNKDLIRFIELQKMFFVATASKDGRINLSPKGLDSLRVIDKNTVLWLNYTGSGNETAAHLRELNRMTMMFCAFEGDPLILRLYGEADTFHIQDQEWNMLISEFPNHAGARNIFKMKINSVQTSCGYAVPYYNFVEQRNRLTKWTAGKGEDGIKEYWQEKNLVSIDGIPTGIK